MEIWLVVDADGEAERELAVELGESHIVAELATRLADQFTHGAPDEAVGASGTRRLYHHRLGSFLAPDRVAVDVDLRVGDRLTLASPAWTPRSPRAGHDLDDPPPVTLSVVSGPDTGQKVALGPGDHVVGRSPEVDVALSDSTVSSRHLQISIAAEGTIEVRDLGSSNGSFLDGRPIDAAPRTLRPGDVIELGHSLVRVDLGSTDATASHASPDGSGSVRFNRPPRTIHPRRDRVFVLGPAPAAAAKNRLPTSTALGPLIFGIPILGFAIASGNTAMIVLGAATMLASPLLAVASHLEDRRSGRSSYERARAKYRADIAQLGEDMASSLAAEEVERRTAVPAAADLLDRAAQLRPSLWERRPEHEDFLHIAAGWADLPSVAELVITPEGDEQLRREARDTLETHLCATNVPVLVPLRDTGVVGLCGDPDAAAGCARWLVAQIASLHSPREIALAAAVEAGAADEWSWMGWLPHIRSEDAPIHGRRLTTDGPATAELIAELSQVVLARGAERTATGSAPPRQDVVLLVIGDVGVPRGAMTTLLEDGPRVGVYTLWLDSTRERLPGSTGTIIECALTPPTCDVTRPREASTVNGALLGQMRLDRATDLARGLAPIRDVTAGGSRGQIPARVDLVELLDLDPPTPESLRHRWEASGFGVAAPLGRVASGDLVLDLRADGPHALVGGTTGAGKSELLQAFIAALAVAHPPDRVTFLLVDYKGGAAFKDVAGLPHTVGLVTDLDGHLVNRALTSLDAELRHREHLLRDHGARDLIEMEQRLPHLAPPSLVLVVDEFASLAKELPEFVDGVVNVAQRGRSLGIHMILATQRPAGAINDNIRANTNLRIALRMNDIADSDDVIAASDAAFLPRSLRGRAFVRTGQTELTEVQVAYAGGHALSTSGVDTAAIEVWPIRHGEARRGARDQRLEDVGRTDIQVLVDALRSAAHDAAISPPRRPWLPTLPEVLPRVELTGERTQGRVLLGVADLPEEQQQRAWYWDLEAEGNLLVYGGGGSGKTTLLRTIAVDLATTHRPDQVHVYALDFASRGLLGLQTLPHVGAVVAGDDGERVRSLLSMLERDLSARRTAFAQVGASLLSEYERLAPDSPLPRIVVLLDGYAGFQSEYDRIDLGTWVDRLWRIVADGRALGIHLVLTGDGRAAIPHALSALAPSKVVFRLGDDDEYGTLGLDPRLTRGAKLPPGRAFAGPTLEVQVALVGDDPSGDGQLREVARIGQELRDRYPGESAPTVVTLPEEVALDTLPIAAPLHAIVGVDQTQLAPLGLSLQDGNVLVAGPNRSGRSTALVSIVRALQRSTPDARFVLLAPRRSPLLELDLWEQVARGGAACDEVAASLETLVAERDAADEQHDTVVIVVDDATELTDTDADTSLELLARRGRDLGVRIVAAAESTLARRSFGGVISELRRDREGLLLRPDPDLDGDLLNVTVPRSAAEFWVPGRAVWVSDGLQLIGQVAI